MASAVWAPARAAAAQPPPCLPTRAAPSDPVGAAPGAGAWTPRSWPAQPGVAGAVVAAGLIAVGGRLIGGRAPRPRGHRASRRASRLWRRALVKLAAGQAPSKAFYDACRLNKEKRALRLLAEYPEAVLAPLLDATQSDRPNALSWACWMGLVDVVQAILAVLPKEGGSGVVGPAFSRACSTGRVRVLELFPARFREEVRRVAAREFLEACHAGRADVLRFLIREFPEEALEAVRGVNALDQTTALYWACRKGHADVVTLLAREYPDHLRAAMRLVDVDGHTPLAWACENKHEDVVRLLLKAFPVESAVVADEPVQPALADKPAMLEGASRDSYAELGYRVVGSHSAVKQCRWTGHGLRGEGQCYKHTFYGINSHQCMEGTPSLACANKCVFCWRSHTNPVATSWTYQTDDPAWVVQESVRNHLELIDEVAQSAMVIPGRLDEARTVRHMALSLVGEPVLYPEMPSMVEALHRRRISTFLVTNGQFPEQLAQLPWVTQLYVSLDAPNPEELKTIGRPLFRDYWERLRQSLTVLRQKRPWQRTVCRMTVIKGKNMEASACEGFAELIGLADNDFVEVKGATASSWEKIKNGLSLANAPNHTDVRTFARELVQWLPDYAIACEHEHSCAVLLARRDRFFDPYGQWRTWIDFERFADAAIAGTPLEVGQFTKETPQWALMDSREAGFDPVDRRRIRRPPAALAAAAAAPVDAAI